MGGNPSKSRSRDGSSHGRYAHSSSFQQPTPWGGGGYYGQDAQSGYYGVPPQGGGYASPYPAYQVPPAAAPPPQPAGRPKPQLDRRYSRIADDYHSVDQLPSKRVMDGPSFDVHRAESSHQNVMAGPATLDPVRAEAASKHVKALNTQFASWVQLQLQNHPLEIWEDGLKDYMSHASEIMEKFKDVVDWLRKNKAGSKGVSSPGPLNDEKTNLQAEDSSKSVAQTSSDSGQKVPTTSSPFSVSQRPNSPSTFSFSSQQKPPSFTGTFGDKKSTPSDSSKSTFQFGGTNSIFGAKNSPGDSSKPALQFGATNSIFGDKNSPSDSSKPAFQFAANNSIFGDKKSPSDSSKPAFQFGASNSIFGDKNSPSNSIFGDKKSPSDSSKPAFQIGASNSIFGDKNSPSDSSKPAFSFGANNGISASTSNSPSIFSNSSAQSFSMQTPALFSVNQQSFPSGKQNAAEASADADEDAEPEKPSSPSVKKAEEKGIVVVHEAKCKVYVKHDDASKGWKDIGVGQLSIRGKEGAEKASKESTPTIVIRNDVGKILLNALIYKGIKMNVQKNTVASIFHTSDAQSSESDGGTVVARTYLFRLKNEEEATKLSTAIKENAPTD